jgi:hypothetical protein
VRVEDPQEDRSLAEAVEAAKEAERDAKRPGDLVAAARGVNGAAPPDGVTPPEPPPSSEVEEVTR